MRKLEQYTEGKTHVAAALVLKRGLCDEVNYYKRVAWWGRAVHMHDEFYQFLLVTGGRAIIELENNRYELGAGDISIIAPNVPHRIYTNTGYEQVGSNYNCLGDAANTSLCQLLRTYASPFLFVHRPDLLNRAEELIHLLETESLFTDARARLLTQQMMVEALEEQAFGREDRFDIELSRYLSEHLGDKLTLKTIADHFHISTSQLERTSQKFFGMGTIALYNQKRYVYAVGQVRQTKLSMSEIARSIGFDDVSNFSAFISKRSGKSPSMIRKHAVWRPIEKENE